MCREISLFILGPTLLESLKGLPAFLYPRMLVSSLCRIPQNIQPQLPPRICGIIRKTPATVWMPDRVWSRRVFANCCFQAEVLNLAYLDTRRLLDEMLNFVNSSFFRMLDVFDNLSIHILIPLDYNIASRQLYYPIGFNLIL